MSLNSLVFHTSVGISSSPAAFVFPIFLSIESSSSCINYHSLMSFLLVIIFVIGSSVTFGVFHVNSLKFISTNAFVLFGLKLSFLLSELSSFYPLCLQSAMLS